MKNQIANTIISQLGGLNKLRAMINAKNFATDGEDLQFQFSGSKIFNMINIKYNSNLDLYNVTLYKFWNLEIKNKKSFDNVYCDMLVNIFESETKLRLSLQKV